MPNYSNWPGWKVPNAHYVLREHLCPTLCWSFCFSRIYLFLPLEMHSFSCEWNQPQSFCYIQCLKRICIISSVSRISFHNDRLHWLALKVFITHLILIGLLILLMFQLIFSVWTYWHMIWYVEKENTIKDNQISSFSCSWKKIMSTWFQISERINNYAGETYPTKTARS